MKKNYPLALVLNIVSLLAMLAGCVYGAAIILNGTHYEEAGFGAVKEVAGATEGQIQMAAVIAVVSVVQFLILRKPLHNMLHEAIMENEYDEFGRNKKKTFDNLTRQEREEMDRQQTALMEQLLPSGVLKKITKKGSENPEKDLEKLVGLHEVKQKVTEMAARMKFEMDAYKDMKKKSKNPTGMNGRHFVFFGNPGTGKTTVARIIAGFLYKNGYIKKNKVIEINGGMLKAGEMSEQKTKLIIQAAYDGVLFIDEAYSIIEGNAEYGKAAIAELIKEMEDNRDRFTVILAGYKKDIKRLLDSNEGFKSRIKEYLEFPDYSDMEMAQIFTDMAHDSGFGITAGALENFNIRLKSERTLPSFGNGRTVRNILDEAIDKHALNYGQGILGDDEHTNMEYRFFLCEPDVSVTPNKNVL